MKKILRFSCLFALFLTNTFAFQNCSKYQSNLARKGSFDNSSLAKQPEFQNCSVGDVIVLHQEVKVFFSSTIAPDCDSVKQARICTNGKMSGDPAYSFLNCTLTPIGIKKSCSVGSTVLTDGQSKTFYNSTSSDSCDSNKQVRLCTDGTISGDEWYNQSSCSPIVITPKQAILIIFAGESNAGTQISNDRAFSYEIGLRPNVKILNNLSLQFEGLKIGGNNSIDERASVSNAHGWELGLANLVDGGAFSGKDVYLVKTAQGGALIGQYNENADGDYRKKVISRSTAALNEIRKLGQNPTVFIVYSQGINNILFNTPADEWKSATENYFNVFKSLFGQQVKIIITSFGHFPQYNSAIDGIVQNSSGNYRSINTNGYSLQDPYHWDYNATKEVIRNAVEIMKSF